jgi:hypothetical protein
LQEVAVVELALQVTVDLAEEEVEQEDLETHLALKHLVVEDRPKQL